MDVLEIPYNKDIGLEKSTDDRYLLMLSDKENYLNHLGTVHASALFALAEATSGFFLLNEFQGMEDVLPVVRKVETKYKRPAQGMIFAKANFVQTDKGEILDELNTRQRTLLTVSVALYDAEQNNVMQSDFEWFVAKRK